MQTSVRLWRHSRAKLIFVIVSAGVLSASATMSAAVNVWTARGPDGGYTGRPLIDAQNPSILYVLAGGRLFKSTDAAANWNELNNFAPAPRGTVPDSILALDPRDSTTLYGSSNVFPGPKTFIFKSTDSGATWGMLAPPPKPGFLRAIAIDPANSNTLYMAGDAGFFKSTDGGATWSETDSGLPSVRFPDGSSRYNVFSVLTNPQKPGTLFVLAVTPNGTGLYKSTDGASTWIDANSGLRQAVGIDTVAIDPQNPDTMYATATHPQSSIQPQVTPLFKSTDAGASWNVVNAEFLPGTLALDPQTSGVLYVSVLPFGYQNRGIWKSTDGGATLNQVFSLPAWWILVAPLEPRSSPGAPSNRQPTSVYAGVGPFGIFKSVDGATWAASNSGLNATGIAAIAISPRDPAVIYTAVSNAGLFKSAGNGRTWNWGGLGGFVASLLPQSSGTLFASSNGRAFKTTDEGANWMPLGVSGILAIDPVNPNTIYAQGGFKSTDGGASWVKLAIPQSVYITTLAIDPQAPKTLYVAGSTNNMSQVFKSLDGGESWTPTPIATGTFYWNTLAVDPLNPATVYAAFACTEYYYRTCVGEPPKFKSTDGGATWAKWDVPPSSSLLTFDPQGSIYASDGLGLLKSADRGETWSRVTASGLTSTISALAIDPRNPNHLFAGTATAGVFEITLAAAEP